MEAEPAREGVYKGGRTTREQDHAGGESEEGERRDKGRNRGPREQVGDLYYRGRGKKKGGDREKAYTDVTEGEARKKKKRVKVERRGNKTGRL